MTLQQRPVKVYDARQDFYFSILRDATVEECDNMAQTDSCKTDLDYDPRTPCHSCTISANDCVCERFNLVPGSRMVINKAKEIRNNGTA